MYKTIIVFVLVAVTCTTASITFEKLNSSSVFTAKEEKGFIYSYPEGHNGTMLYAIPPDSGGNWGDNILYLGEGEPVLADLRISFLKYPYDVSYEWKYNSGNNKRISSVFAINLGRERAFISEIKVLNDRKSCAATIQVRAYEQFRIVIAVYETNGASKVASGLLISLSSIIYMISKLF